MGDTVTSVPGDLRIMVDRDSVCAGDDCVSHAKVVSVPPQAPVPELVRRATAACPLASISGGKATWIVEAGGWGGRPVAVIAQQWDAPCFLAGGGGTVGSLFGGCEPRLVFRYWCQADPQAVFDALAAGAPLPARAG